jgi:hypothetical protein
MLQMYVLSLNLKFLNGEKLELFDFHHGGAKKLKKGEDLSDFAL